MALPDRIESGPTITSDQFKSLPFEGRLSALLEGAFSPPVVPIISETMNRTSSLTSSEIAAGGFQGRAMVLIGQDYTIPPQKLRKH